MLGSWIFSFLVIRECLVELDRSGTEGADGFVLYYELVHSHLVRVVLGGGERRNT